MRGLTIGFSIKIVLFASIVYLLVLIPPGFILRFGIIPLFSQTSFGLILGLCFLLADLWVFLLSAILIPGMFWRVMNLRYTGEHVLDISHKMIRNWLTTHVIYIPTAVILDLFHLYPLKAIHVRMFGGKLGKNVVVGGLITDPSLLEVDSHTNIGGFSIILGHAVEHDKIVFAKVRIGKSCGIGVRSIILPGTTLEDHTFLGAQSLLSKYKIILQREKYGGVPAKKIYSPSE